MHNQVPWLFIPEVYIVSSAMGRHPSASILGMDHKMVVVYSLGLSVIAGFTPEGSVTVATCAYIWHRVCTGVATAMDIVHRRGEWAFLREDVDELDLLTEWNRIALTLGAHAWVVDDDRASDFCEDPSPEEPVSIS